MAKKKEIKLLDLPNFEKMDTLMILRLIILSIFVLSTISMILAFITEFIFSVVLLLISYILVFVLMIKLFLIKEL